MIRCRADHGVKTGAELREHFAVILMLRHDRILARDVFETGRVDIGKSDELDRSGNTITAQRSTNGTTWVTVGSQSITMGANVFVGMAVTSKVAGTLNTTTFDNVSVTQP